MTPRPEAEPGQSSECEPAQLRNETVHLMIKITPLAHRESIEKREIPKVLRNDARLGHHGAINENRNDPEAELQRRFDLDPDGIVGGGNPERAVTAWPGPSGPDDGDQNAGALQGLANMLPEIKRQRE